MKATITRFKGTLLNQRRHNFVEAVYIKKLRICSKMFAVSFNYINLQNRSAIVKDSVKALPTCSHF